MPTPPPIPRDEIHLQASAESWYDADGWVIPRLARFTLALMDALEDLWPRVPCVWTGSQGHPLEPDMQTLENAKAVERARALLGREGDE